MNMVSPSECLQELLPVGVVTAVQVGEGDPAALLTGERQHRGHAPSKRAREFAAGRLCARRAAAEFGVVEGPIGVGQDRCPRWPPHLTGSITHTDGFSAAAVGSRRKFQAIGIDAERAGSVSQELWNHIFQLAEVQVLERLPAWQQAHVATLMFSAKEAFYKCQYAVTGRWLEFKDVAVTLSGRRKGRGAFTVHFAPGTSRDRLFPATGRFGVANNLVLTAVALAVR